MILKGKFLEKMYGKKVGKILQDTLCTIDIYSIYIYIQFLYKSQYTVYLRFIYSKYVSKFSSFSNKKCALIQIEFNK